ncbi:MAG TPA: carboxypeptidase-like regulatory domain-containing protein [Gemmatimonadaceae bacterium]|nr:carboxypeptidase-like regulatory domain-containing protein [Gemmatimonadaceae bacterium]
MSPRRYISALLTCVTAGGALHAQEIRGLAKIDARGDAVWGANVALIDSLGREAATTKSNRKGEFLVRAPGPGTYWLQLSARSVGRMSSPVFVLDSGATLHYEHIFRRSLSSIARGEDNSAQRVLQEPFRDSTAGSLTRGTSSKPLRQVNVRVLDIVSGAPIPDAEVVLVSVDPRAEHVVGGKTRADGAAALRDVQQLWYRVVGRRVGFEPGGTRSFPIIGDADSISVELRLSPVTVLDAVTVMERRISSFGFNLKLLSRYYLGRAELAERSAAARNIDDLITSLRIPGLGIKTGDMTSVMTYRGQRVEVFILDGTRTSNELPLVEPSSVESLMFIPPNEAGAVFGPDTKGGVLIINTRQR